MKRIILAISLLTLTGCSKNAPGHNTSAIRTDTEPIIKRLPALGGKVAAVYWESINVSKDSVLSPPGKSLYQLLGYAVLTEEAAQEIRRSYQWMSVATSWKPTFAVEAIGPVEGNWLTSGKFTDEAKTPLVGGTIYLLSNRDVLFFDLQVE